MSISRSTGVLTTVLPCNTWCNCVKNVKSASVPLQPIQCLYLFTSACLSPLYISSAVHLACHSTASCCAGNRASLAPLVILKKKGCSYMPPLVAPGWYHPTTCPKEPLVICSTKSVHELPILTSVQPEYLDDCELKPPRDQGTLHCHANTYIAGFCRYIV